MIKPIQFRRFRSRILFWLLLLSLPIQFMLYVAIQKSNFSMASNNIQASLTVTADIFDQVLQQKRESLLAQVRALSSDYAFKPAANTNEHETVLSVLQSYQARIGADVMIVVTMTDKIIADTLHPHLFQQNFYLPSLLEAAQQDQYGEADKIMLIDDKPYLLVCVPLFSPDPSHWIIIGFEFNLAFIQQLKSVSHSEVSLLRVEQQQGVQVLQSTLAPEIQKQLASQWLQLQLQPSKTIQLKLQQQQFIASVRPLDDSKNAELFILLQQSLSKALAPYQQLQNLVLAGFIISSFLLMLGGFYIGRKISKPVSVLADGAEQIQQGNYQWRISIKQKDELGTLATRFNQMASGLAEREKVKSLLGKVVSPEIAKQLMQKRVELGGELVNCTMLFSDIREFTQYCELHSAKQVVDDLNTWLSEFSYLIEKHHGVIDKYIGDAIMALFGVPVADEKQAVNAVKAALAMQNAVKIINQQRKQQGLAEIAIGVGIHTDSVIAGNIGSPSRLNYSVVGDGVNLASRCESLTKFYQVPILVTEPVVQQVQQFESELLFMKVDFVAVKGKQQAVNLYQPLGYEKELLDEQLKLQQAFANMLDYYQNQQWHQAQLILFELEKNFPNLKLIAIYQQRIKQLQQNKLVDWDGIFRASHK